METKTMKTTPEVAMKIQEIQEKFDQQKTHLAIMFDEQVAKIESDYRVKRDELDVELFKFKDNQRKQRLELQETYLKARREMIHRKHEAQTSLESTRQKECLKVRMAAAEQEAAEAAPSGEAEGTGAE